MNTNQLPSKGMSVEIYGHGVYIEQIDLFKDYCKVLVNGRQITLPIDIITKMEKKGNVNTNKKDM